MHNFVIKYNETNQKQKNIAIDKTNVENIQENFKQEKFLNRCFKSNISYRYRHMIV